LGMSPNSDSSSLEISASDSIGTKIGQTVVFHLASFKEIEKLAFKLTPSLEVADSFIAGLVTDLHGERTIDGRPSGDIEVAFQYNDEDIVKARVTLNVFDYALALNAHSKGHYVSFKGALKLGVRSHKVTDIRDFRDLQNG
jgi:hypothetical protein